jgi:hypothetical protein
MRFSSAHVRERAFSDVPREIVEPSSPGTPIDVHGNVLATHAHGGTEPQLRVMRRGAIDLVVGGPDPADLLGRSRVAQRPVARWPTFQA